MTAVEALLHGAIDCAGLFPPAALDLETTVRNYERYRAEREAWALGRFVLPASQLAEFADRWPRYVAEWPISFLPGADFDSEMRLAVDAGLRLDAVEWRPARLEDIGAIRKRMPRGALLFVESPQGVAQSKAVRAIAEAGACAKVRTGGIVADAIPGASPVAAFLVDCAQRGLCLKATAGLHHAIRGEYRLTYAADSPSGCMHGFVNFFLAAAMALGGADEAHVAQLLNDGNRDNFSANKSEVRWRDARFSLEEIQRMRRRFVISFGSCSFEEPVAEMRTMGWIE